MPLPHLDRPGAVSRKKLSAHTVSAAEARSITPTTRAIAGTSRTTTKAVNAAITHSRIATESLMIVVIWSERRQRTRCPG